MSQLYRLSAEQKARGKIARERRRVRLARNYVSWLCIQEARVIIWLAERELERTRYRYAGNLVETIPSTLRSPWIGRSTLKKVAVAVIYG